MIHNLSRVTVAFIISIALSVSLVYAADQPYIVSFIAGPTGFGVVKVTRTDAGIRLERTSIVQPLPNLGFGSTAVVPLRSALGDLVGSGVYATYIGTGTIPIETSFFIFNELNNLIGSESTGLRLGQFQPLHTFQAGAASRLLAPGVVRTAGANDYVSYALNPPSGAKKNIFVNPPNRTAATAAAAPDGGLVTQMTFAGLNHAGLDRKLNNGNLAGAPVPWLNVNDFQGYSESLTNPIAQAAGTSNAATGTRYLAYRNFRLPGTTNSQSQVMIQNLDATTGQLQGGPRAITNLARALNVAAERFQSIAISPDGGLILYTIWNNACRKQILVALRLANGVRLGAPKTVIGCNQLGLYPTGIFGINIAPLF